MGLPPGCVYFLKSTARQIPLTGTELTQCRATRHKPLEFARAILGDSHVSHPRRHIPADDRLRHAAAAGRRTGCGRAEAFSAAPRARSSAARSADAAERLPARSSAARPAPRSPRRASAARTATTGTTTAATSSARTAPGSASRRSIAAVRRMVRRPRPTARRPPTATVRDRRPPSRTTRTMMEQAPAARRKRGCGCGLRAQIPLLRSAQRHVPVARRHAQALSVARYFQQYFSSAPLRTRSARSLATFAGSCR